MNIEVRAKERSQKTTLDIVDCDFHPKLTLEQLRPYLSNQWWSYLQTYGNRSRHGYAKGYAYPKMTPQAARRDAWPPGGGLPASDLDFVQQQHLDFYGVSAAIMNPLSPTGQGDMNVELSVAMATAANEAQVAQVDRARSAAEIVRGGALRRQRRLGQRGQEACRRQELRAGVPAEPDRRSRSAAGATGRFTKPRSRRVFRSASTCSAIRAGR